MNNMQVDNFLSSLLSLVDLCAIFCYFFAFLRKWHLCVQHSFQSMGEQEPFIRSFTEATKPMCARLTREFEWNIDTIVVFFSSLENIQRFLSFLPNKQDLYRLLTRWYILYLVTQSLYISILIDLCELTTSSFFVKHVCHQSTKLWWITNAQSNKKHFFLLHLLFVYFLFFFRSCFSINVQ